MRTTSTRSTPLAESPKAVERGVLRSGIMCQDVKRGVDFVLAGSIRDDGPRSGWRAGKHG